MAYTYDPVKGGYFDEAGTPYPTAGAPAPKTSAIGEVLTGIKRGAVSALPEMVGKALKATGKEGDTLYGYGADMEAAAKARGELPENQLNPDQHGWLTNALASGGEMLVPSAVGMAAAAPLAIAGAPAAAITGIGALATGGLFGASQFQETYENVKNAGASDSDAFKAGMISGGIEAAGESLGSWIGARFATRAGSAIAGKTLDSGLKGMVTPNALKSFGASYAKTLGIETGTEMGQNIGEAAVEKAYGVDTDPIAAGMAAVAPTFGLTTLLAPFGLRAAYKQAGQIKNDIAKITAPMQEIGPDYTPQAAQADYEQRVAATNRLGTLLDNSPPPGMEESDWKGQVNEWRLAALERLNDGKPPEISTLMDGAFAASMDKYRQDNFDAQPTAAQPATITDDQGNAIPNPALQPAPTAPVVEPAATVEYNGKSATVKSMKDGAATLQLEDGLTITLPAEKTKALKVVSAAAPAAAAPKSTHPSGVAIGDVLDTPYGTGIASIKGNDVVVTMDDGTVATFGKAHYGSLSSKDSVVNDRLKAAAAAKDVTKDIPDGKAKKAKLPVAQPTTTGGQNGQGQETTEVLKTPEAVIDMVAATVASTHGKIRADVIKNVKSDVAKWTNENGGVLTAAKVAEEANKPRQAESRQKILEALATRLETEAKLQEKPNGNVIETPSETPPAVGQGAKPEPAEGKARPEITAPATRDDSANVAAGGNVSSTGQKGEPLREEVIPASIPASSPDTVPAPATKAQTTTKKEDAARAKEAKKQANLEARRLGAEKIALQVKAKASLEEAERLRKKDDIARARSPEEKEKAFAKMKEEEVADAEMAWNLERNAEAEKVGKGNMQSFFVPEWANLPGPAKASWASGPQQARDYTEAKQLAHELAAIEEAKKVNRNVDKVNIEIANAADYANRLHAIARAVVKLMNDRPDLAVTSKDKNTAALQRAGAQARHNAAVDAVKLEYVKARRMMSADAKAVVKSAKELGATAEQQAELSQAEYRKEADKLTLADVKAGLFKDIDDILPARSGEEYRAMGAALTMDEVTPFHARIAKLYAQDAKGKGRVKRTKEEAAEFVRYKRDLLSALRDLGELANIKRGKITLQGIGESLDAIDAAARAYTSPAVQSALETVNGTNGVAQVLDIIGVSTNNRFLAKLSPLLKAMGVDGIKVAYEDRLMKSGKANADGTFSYKRGNFNTTTNTLTIYQGGENAHVIMHEVVHGLTVASLRRAESIKGTPKTPEERRLVSALNDLKTLYGFLENNPALKGQYAFKNHAEFLAEAMTSAPLQAKLREIAVPQGLLQGQKSWFTSLFDAFTETIKNFLGLKGVPNNALAAAIDVVGPFLSPNTTVTAPRMIAQSKALSAAQKAESLDMITMSPAAALEAPIKTVGNLVSASSRWLDKLDLSNAAATARREAWHISSTMHIQRMIKDAPMLKPLHGAIDLFFVADQAKTRIISHITEYMSKHLGRVETALRKTNQFARNNATMDFLAREQSLIADEAGMTIDPTKDFNGNKAANPTLDSKLEARIDALHREHTKLAQSPGGAELVKLINHGFMLNRKAHIQNNASLLLSALSQHKMSPSSTSSAAEYLLEKYGAKLDIDKLETTHTLTDKTRFLDARTEELDKTLREAFEDAATKFAPDPIHESLGVMYSAYKKSVNNPYQFLNRPGKYFVGFDVANTSRETIGRINAALNTFGVQIGGFPGNSKHVYLHLESPKEMESALAAVRKLGPIIEQKTLSGGAKSDAGALGNAFGASQAIHKLRDLLIGKYEDFRASGQNTPESRVAFDRMVAWVNESLVDMIESDSARTTMTRRKGIPGSDSDYLRTFAKRSEFYISLISNQYAKPKFDAAFRSMKEKIEAQYTENPQAAIRGQEIADELITRHGNSMHPVESPIIDAMKAFGYHFYLSMSPAFAMVNLLQPYHLTLPLLGGRFGFVKSSMAMLNASRLAAKIIGSSIKDGWAEGGAMGVVNAELQLNRAGLSKGQIEFLQQMIKSGTVDFTEANNIGRLSNGNDRRIANAAKALGTLTHYSEVMNRLTAGLAAYNMAESMPVDKRTAYAIDAVNQTQFLYSDHNTARILGRHGFAGKVTPLAASFQNYSFQMMEHYIRLVDQGFIRKLGTVEEQKAARKSLYGTLAATSVLAGTMGLPFANVVAAAFNLGGDDDDIRNGYRRWLDDVFGTDLAEVMAKGVSRAAGFDMAGRAGHQDLLPGSRFIADRRNVKDKVKDGALGVMGPAVNAGIDMLSGLDEISDGNVAKGFENMLPAALRGYYKAANLSDKGSFTNANGTALPIPVDNWDIFVQTMGFTPSKKAEQSEANFYYQSALTMSKQSKAKLVNAAVQAYENGQFEEFGAAVQTIREYNAQNPTSPIADISEKLVGRVRGRAFAEQSGTGIIDSNAAHLPRAADYGWANTGIK